MTYAAVVCTARLVRRRVFLAETASGHHVVVEGSWNGEELPLVDPLGVRSPGEALGEGPGPMDLLAVGLATCAGTAVADILARMRQPVAGLTVSVVGRRGQEPPRLWEDLTLHHRVRGAVLPERVERAAALSLRHCSASVQLSASCAIHTYVTSTVPVAASETRPLRRRILRPHQTLDELVVPGEDSADAGWFAAVRSGEVVGTAGVFREPSPDHPDEADAWRLRAMAVEPAQRGSGLGSDLLESALSHARSQGARVIWASAREPAVGFYRSHGFAVVSDVYHPPDIGPHVRIERSLDL